MGFVMIADCFENLGQPEQALKYYDRAIYLESERGDVHKY